MRTSLPLTRFAPLLFFGLGLFLVSCANAVTQLIAPSSENASQRADREFRESLSKPINQNQNRASYTCFDARVMEADGLHLPIPDVKVVIYEESEKPDAFSATISSRKGGDFQPCVPKSGTEYEISFEREGFEPLHQSTKASSTPLTFFLKRMRTK